MRTATLSSPAVTHSGIFSDFGRIIVKGPGQKFSASCSAVFPTEDAINLVDTIIPISSEFNSFLTKDFSEEEKQQLIKLLNKVYENLLKEELNETKK